MTANTYNIVRRAYSNREVVETFTGTWVAAELHAMKVEAERRDGEYFVFALGEDIAGSGANHQSGFDWL